MTNYDLVYEIGEVIKGVWFDHIEGHSCLGDYGSDAQNHPIQYRAITNTREGDDDPFEGIGWSPSEALRDLYRIILEVVI
jgi:hypothetical protein